MSSAKSIDFEEHTQVEEFNVRQAILRTKLRVQNQREEPIDFIAKVILMIFGLIPLNDDFLTNEYKQSYKIYSRLDQKQLERLLEDMAEYEGANRTSKKFVEYWSSQRSLCNIWIERRKTKHTLTEQDDKIFTEKEL